MKSYLRLLLVASVLLLVLGLFNDQHSKPVVDRSEAANLEQVTVLLGTLPIDPVHAAPRILSKAYHPVGLLAYMRLSQESHQSRLLTNEIQVSKRIRGEISPDLLQRTGYFIYVNSGSEIPS